MDVTVTLSKRAVVRNWIVLSVVVLLSAIMIVEYKSELSQAPLYLSVLVLLFTLELWAKVFLNANRYEVSNQKTLGYLTVLVALIGTMIVLAAFFGQ